MPQGFQNPNFPTRDQTSGPGTESAESYPLDYQRIPAILIFVSFKMDPNSTLSKIFCTQTVQCFLSLNAARVYVTPLSCSDLLLSESVHARQALGGPGESSPHIAQLSSGQACFGAKQWSTDTLAKSLIAEMNLESCVLVWTMYNPLYRFLRASLVAQMVKNLRAMWETWVQSLGWEDPLE